MRILIHALGASMGGAQRYLNGFLPALSTAGCGHRFRVLVRQSSEAAGAPNVEIQRVPDRFAVSAAARIWFDNFHVPEMARQFRADALLSLMNIGPIRAGVPHVILERNALLFARRHWQSFSLGQALRLRLQRLLASACMRRASCVVTPSASMADLVRRSCRSLPEGRIAVRPHAFSAAGYRDELDPAFAQQLRGPGLKILYPALAGPHKGFDRLIEIAQSLPETLGARIYLTGGNEGGRLVETLRRKTAEWGLEDKIVFLGRVPQGSMQALYRACDLMLYVSEIESFGFPLVEAMAFGIPIVAVDTPVNREICAGAALYFDGFDAQAAGRAIKDAVTHYRELRDAGHRQFASVDRSWDTYVQALLRLVESGIGRSALREYAS